MITIRQLHMIWEVKTFITVCALVLGYNFDVNSSDNLLERMPIKTTLDIFNSFTLEDFLLTFLLQILEQVSFGTVT